MMPITPHRNGMRSLTGCDDPLCGLLPDCAGNHGRLPACPRCGSKTDPCDCSRVSAQNPALKPGDLVYRVGEFDPPEEGLHHTWKIESRAIKSASDRQITLASYFYGTSLLQFTPDALGRVFFATPAEAVEAFAWRQRDEMESLDRRRKDAERAILWAYEQGAKVPNDADVAARKERRK